MGNWGKHNGKAVQLSPWKLKLTYKEWSTWLPGRNSGIMFTCDKQKQPASALNQRSTNYKNKIITGTPLNFRWWYIGQLFHTKLGGCRQRILGWKGCKTLWRLPISYNCGWVSFLYCFEYSFMTVFLRLFRRITALLFGGWQWCVRLSPKLLWRTTL